MQLGISDEEMDWRLEQLAVLLPGLVPRLLRAPPKLVARAAAHTQEIGVRLLRLKAAFPAVSTYMLVKCSGQSIHSWDHLKHAISGTSSCTLACLACVHRTRDD
jgi:hypothetical protein